MLKYLKKSTVLSIVLGAMAFGSVAMAKVVDCAHKSSSTCTIGAYGPFSKSKACMMREVQIPETGATQRGCACIHGAGNSNCPEIASMDADMTTFVPVVPQKPSRFSGLMGSANTAIVNCSVIKSKTACERHGKACDWREGDGTNSECRCANEVADSTQCPNADFLNCAGISTEKLCKLAGSYCRWFDSAQSEGCGCRGKIYGGNSANCLNVGMIGKVFGSRPSPQQVIPVTQ